MAKRNKKRKPPALVAVRPNVAGIDIGSTEHWVCAPPGVDGDANVRVFRTTTPQLEELADWLLGLGVESVAMESTYVYWIPVYEVLESLGIEVLLVNARTLHNVPGRKTDMSDCQWLQLLHSCGLLRGSFRPVDAICKTRALRRQMANLKADRTRHVQHMQKALDQMNVQVHRAVTDVTGKTGMGIVRSIVAGERDPETLAAHRDPRCKKSVVEIAEHLTGNWRDEHLFNLASALRMYDFVESEVALFEERLLMELEALVPPERADDDVPAHPNRTKEKVIRRRGAHELRTTLWRLSGVDLTRIDGISAATARIIVTELGVELSKFPSEKHFVSWLRLCPRTPISGGKPLRKRRNGLGATRIANALRMAAVTLQRSKTALGATYRRVARRKGAGVAVFSTARKLAQLIYRMLRFGQDYTDIGADMYEAQFHERRLHGLKRASAELGFTLIPAAPPAAR